MITKIKNYKSTTFSAMRSRIINAEWRATRTLTSHTRKHTGAPRTPTGTRTRLFTLNFKLCIIISLTITLRGKISILRMSKLNLISNNTQVNLNPYYIILI
uniref:Uncharacterized protein n=1 Tax=Pararge aegeria TaxID=116150 RepID=S4PYC3_9NEOP